jgi:hypothetical protein
MWGCPSAGCPAPLHISGLYEERVNCDEANMCVIEDETDMVAVEADADDPTQITFVSLLTGVNGQGALCGSRVDWTGSTEVRNEEGSWIFGAAANTYTRTREHRSCTCADPEQTAHRLVDRRRHGNELRVFGGSVRYFVQMDIGTLNGTRRGLLGVHG